MPITLEQIVALQHNQLNTLPRKIIWLMIRNQADVFGWSTISSADFCIAKGNTKAIYALSLQYRLSSQAAGYISNLQLKDIEQYRKRR